MSGGMGGRRKSIFLFPFFIFILVDVVAVVVFVIIFGSRSDIMKEKKETEELSRENVNKRKISINN